MSGALAACLAAAIACAPSAEISIGGSYFEPSEPGIWWQPDYPRTLRMASPSIGLGAIGATRALVLRAGIEWLGCVSSSAQAIPSDHPLPGDVWPIAHWYGRGCATDIYLTASNKGAWFVEGGVVAGWRSWTMEVPDWRAPREVAPECAPNCPVQPIRVDHRNRIQWGLVGGAGYRQADWSIALTVRDGRSLGDGWPSVANGLVFNLALRKAW